MSINNLDCKMIFDNAPFTMVYIDRQMRVVEINRAMAQTLDLDFEEIEGRYCYEVWGQYSTEKKQRICDNCGAKKALADGKTHIYERKRGESIYEVTSFPVWNKEKKIIGAVEISSDITQRVLDQRLLFEIEERYNYLFNNLGDAAFLIDVKSLLFLDANDVAVERLGYSREELLTMTPFQVNIREQGGFVQDCFDHAREKGVYTYESVHLSKDGTKIPVEIRARYLEIDGKGVVLALARDITVRKEVEEKLRSYGESMRNMAMRINDVEEIERKRLASELHDEVGQSLTALGINLQIMQNSIDMEDFPEHHLRLHDSAELVKDISVKTRDLMADLRSPVLDDFGLVAGLRSYAEQVASRSGVFISIGEDLLPTLPENLQNTLFRVVKEAICNAVNHGRPKAVIVTFQLRDSVCKIVVEDDGVGFLVKKVFNDGNGQHWGLITMQERIAALGGKFEILSELGDGTTITIEVNL